MRFLNQSSIEAAVGCDEVTEAVEQALDIYAKKAFDMPERFHFTASERTMMYMPCMTQREMGTKILSIYPENGPKGLPVISGIMLMNKLETGEPLAILDGKAVTGMRTGAVGGIGVKYLSRPDISTAGIIGAGAQAYYQVKFALSHRNIKTLNLYSRTESKVEALVEQLKNEFPEVEYRISGSPEEAVKNSELVIVATSSMTPVLPDDAHIYRGKVIVAIGSYKPDMRELSDGLIKAASRVYADILYAAEESGDLKIPIEQGILNEESIRPISDVIVIGEKPSYCNVDETVLYKSVGMALFDVCVGQRILEESMARDFGQEIEW